MDRELVSADISSFQLASPSELDRGFCVNQSSSVYDLSLEGSVSIPSHEIVCEYSETKPSLTTIRDPFNTMSPSQASNTNTMSMEETRTPITIPAQSSTPCMFLQKTSSPDKLCVGSTASNVSWEFSFIKTDINNPQLTLGSSTLESTWSPKYISGSASTSLAELPSLIWSGTSQHINGTDEYQKSWSEDSVGSSQTSCGSAPVAEECWQKQTSSPACVDNKDKTDM